MTKSTINLVLPICLSAYLSARPPIYLPACLSAYLPICLSAYLPACHAAALYAFAFHASWHTQNHAGTPPSATTVKNLLLDVEHSRAYLLDYLSIACLW